MLSLEAWELLDVLSLQAWVLVLELTQESARIRMVTQAGSRTGIWMEVCENLSFVLKFHYVLEFHLYMRISSLNSSWNFNLI
jgi:hypothetical protein